MLKAPSFENSVLVTEDPILAAQVSALFVRPGKYLPIISGPRMKRQDAANEIIRCRNAMARIGARQELLGGLSPSANSAIGAGWSNCTISNNYDDHAQALKGQVRHPKGILRWGPNNLGIGLYQARLKRQEFQPDLDVSPSLNVVETGIHLLIACEKGDLLAEVIASNIAFACKASFAVFEELDTSDRESWLEEIYALGDGGDVTGRFIKQVQQARDHLGELDFTRHYSSKHSGQPLNEMF